MADGASLKVTYDVGRDPDHVWVDIAFRDPKMQGKEAKLQLVATCRVSEVRPVNGSKELFGTSFRVSGSGHKQKIPIGQHRTYTYSGQNISIVVSAKLVVDDAWVFDTKVEQSVVLQLAGNKPRVKGNASRMIDPDDAFEFVKNLKAVPWFSQIQTLLIVVIGVVVLGANTLVGIHDQGASQSNTIIYHFDGSDDEGGPPILAALAVDVVIAVVMWWAMQRQLGKYMTLQLRRLPSINRSTRLRVSELIEGKSRVDLENIILRVVACNMEKGQYREGHGTQERTVSFEEPVRAVKLFEKKVSLIPAGQPVSSFFDDEIAFEPMFAALYPPNTISSRHGLEIYWEVQLIHKEFVDQELVCPVDLFRYEDFLAA
ncbi:MAG: hypothetical protein H8E27_12330 [Verrucomicrobia subdivision 3 bacterium]|nr:hypothetical protein [Limisphaerales bacterium]